MFGRIIFRENSKDAPNLIFPVIIFVTGSPDLTSGAVRPTHITMHTHELGLRLRIQSCKVANVFEVCHCHGKVIH